MARPIGIRPTRALPAAAALLLGMLQGGGAQGNVPRFDTFEVFAPNGGITRVSIPAVDSEPASAKEFADAAGEVIPLHQSGPSSNRFDLVIVGDGYTEHELDLFHQHAADKWSTIRTTEPFASYQDYFNVWMVDVVSSESGVDNDPYPGTLRDTALDMQFWCGGTERLLCMNESKAEQLAALAPAADHVLGLANSTKYGGAGGPYATSSGGNQLAAQITVHELGHSIGDLADEYDYTYRLGLEDDSQDDVRLVGPYIVYVGGEPDQHNISASTHEQIAAETIKWWRWLGEPSPDGTAVSAYEGGGQYKLGIYRPTDASLMRVLGKPFNLPSREKMTVAFYAWADPIDAAPPVDVPLDGVSPVTIQVLQPLSHDLTIDWYLDGERVPSARNMATFEFPGGTHTTLAVRVVDATAFVRDPEWISSSLTQELTWSVSPVR